jgi:3-phenylpropionate/trans-cinnamate dioxygenase ferredoxin subunit
VPSRPYQAVAKTAEVDETKTLCVQVEGREILVCHTSEGFFAVDNICSHAHQQLHLGKLKGQRILCPLHGAAFDVRTGAVLSRPATKPLRSYPVRIEGDQISIAIGDSADEP